MSAAAAAAALISGLLSGCGSAGGEAGQEGQAGEAAPTITITSPEDGATVSVPFTLEFTSSEEIGPTESGKHHAHLFTDGKTDDYTVVTEQSVQVDKLSPGTHKVGVTLQRADHSPAGAQAEITVTVSGGAGSPQPTGDDDVMPGY